jgi:hypothetical protein
MFTSKGECFLVSEEDWDEISQFKWHISNRGYARRGCNKDEEALLSRYIMKNIRKLDIENLFVDHIDRNPLNNQRYNLRTVTVSENNRNIEKRDNCTSQYRGVHFSQVNNYLLIQNPH